MAAVKKSLDLQVSSLVSYFKKISAFLVFAICSHDSVHDMNGDHRRRIKPAPSVAELSQLKCWGKKKVPLEKTTQDVAFEWPPYRTSSRLIAYSCITYLLNLLRELKVHLHDDVILLSLPDPFRFLISCANYIFLIYSLGLLN